MRCRYILYILLTCIQGRLSSDFDFVFRLLLFYYWLLWSGDEGCLLNGATELDISNETWDKTKDKKRRDMVIY